MVKPRKAVIGMQAYNPPTSNRENSLRLDFNENTEGCSAKAINALKSTKPTYLATYPEYKKLRVALASYCEVDVNEIIPTNGTDEAIKTIIETYIEKGKDEIIIPIPTFPMYKFYSQLNEAIIREISYNQDLSFPSDKIIEAINRNTKIIVLVNPNNPTGTSIKQSDIIRIVRKAKSNDALVLIDEAYYQFYGKTSIPLIKKYDNLFVTQTFSKAFGLAGLRLGYIVSNKENIKVIQKVLSSYSVNNLAVVCASAALKDLAYTKAYTKEVNKSKSVLYKELEKLGIEYYKSDANFVLLRIGSKSANFCQKLREKGILVRDKSNDILLNGCVRITLGTLKQTKVLIKALNQAIKEINPILIFDIDGVLADVSKSYRVTIKKTGEYFTKKEISFEEIQDYKNKGSYNNDWDLTEAVIKDKGINVNKELIVEKFQSYYNELKNKEKWILDKKLLKKLLESYNLAILTGRPKKEAFYILKKNKVISYFKTIIAMEDISRQKPNQEGLLKILDKYSKSEAYYFGDSIDDMKASVLAKINPIGVLPPQDKSSLLLNLLIRNGAKFVITDINNIMEALK